MNQHIEIGKKNDTRDWYCNAFSGDEAITTLPIIIENEQLLEVFPVPDFQFKVRVLKATSFNCYREFIIILSIFQLIFYTTFASCQKQFHRKS